MRKKQAIKRFKYPKDATISHKYIELAIKNKKGAILIKDEVIYNDGSQKLIIEFDCDLLSFREGIESWESILKLTPIIAR